MSYLNHIKSINTGLSIQDILKSKPDVLLGINNEALLILDLMKIRSVFDLSMSVIFSNATRVNRNKEDLSSHIRKHGRAPAAMIDKDELTAHVIATLPLESVKALIGIGDFIATSLGEKLSISTIRDLALWPPYIAAKAILREGYGIAPAATSDPEAPESLIPKSGEFGTERYTYSSIVMFPGTYRDRGTPLNKRLFDITLPDTTGFDLMRFGARITYEQNWIPKSVAKGQLLHSLPLAPGESTNVAVIDWTNKAKTATTQTLSASDKINSTTTQKRAITQISESVASDFQEGSSDTFSQSSSANIGVGGILGLGIFGASASGNESSTSTHVVSTGVRKIDTELRQNIAESTQQNSTSIRSQRAAVVSEVSQRDSKNFSTRNITNYNHMHAMTIQYYEVVQQYETQVRNHNVERCIFIPMTLIDFNDERNIFKFLPILKRVALNYNMRNQLLNLEETSAGYNASFGLERMVGNALINPFARVKFRDIVRNLKELDLRGFVRQVGSGITQLNLDFLLQLNNIQVVRQNGVAGNGLIAAFIIVLEDNTEIRIASSPVNQVSNANVVHPSLGSSRSFGKIKAIRLETRNFTPPPLQVAASYTEILMSVKLNGESRYMNLSFFMSGTSTAYSGSNLLTITSPSEISTIGDELMLHRLYYSQKIWMLENPQKLIMQFAPFKLAIDGVEINLVDYIEPRPLKVVGNYLVYLFRYEKDAAWKNWMWNNVDRSQVLSDQVAIPTGGVFAEAVLGRFNSAEKLDVTRFSNWNDSVPPVLAPSINPVSFTEPTGITLPGQTNFGAPVLSVNTPINFGGFSGLSDALSTIVNGKSFKDISGATQSGEITNNALASSSEASVAALTASADTFKGLISSLSKALQSATSKEATKNISDAAALMKVKKDTENLGSSSSAESPSSAVRFASALLEDGPLAPLFRGGVTTIPSASPPESAPTATDPALLASALITETNFTNVVGFLKLLDLIEDDELQAIIERRFSNLAATVDLKIKFTELMNEYTAHNSELARAEQILYVLNVVKSSVLPNESGFDQNKIGRVREIALNRLVDKAFTTAKAVRNSDETKVVIKEVLNAAVGFGEFSINHISYMLATAYHESAMGKFMTEITNGVSTDTLFTKDAFFFNAKAGVKSSYNGINGNLLAGDQLATAGVISDPAVKTLWNANVYPDAQPAAEKISARDCDYYRFIGRGLVQITGRSNYQRYANKPEFQNIDFLTEPEKVSEVIVASAILVSGMTKGEFRAKKLSDFDLADSFDAFNARDIVNGDKATKGARIKQITEDFKKDMVINTKLDESLAIK